MELIIGCRLLTNKYITAILTATPFPLLKYKCSLSATSVVSSTPRFYGAWMHNNNFFLAYLNVVGLRRNTMHTP